MPLGEQVVIELVDKFTNTAKAIDSKIKDLSSSFSYLAGGAALGGVVYAIGNAVKKFAEQEKVATQLNFALRSVGVTSRSVTDDYLEFAKQLSRTTMYQDEEIVKVETLLTTYGLYGEQLKRTVKVAADFATLTGKDLYTAATDYTKATQGNVMALNKWGLGVSDAEITAKGFNAVLEKSESMFKGVASAAINTTAGALDQFKKGMEDVEKTMGHFFASFDKQFGVTKYLTKTFQDLADGLDLLSDPMFKINNQAKELIDLKDKLEQEVKLGMNKGLDDFNLKRIKEINVELATLNDQAKKVSDTMNSGKVGKIGDLFPKATDTETQSFNKYIDGIVAKNADGYEKIQAERQKDLNELNKLAVKSLKDSEKHIAARQAIDRKALKDTVILASQDVSAGFNAVEHLAKGNINGFINSVKSMLPPVAQAVVTVAQSAVGAIKAVFSLFGSDTRTETQKTLDSLKQISEGINKARADLDALRAERDKVSHKNVGDFKTAGLTHDQVIQKFKDIFGEIAFTNNDYNTGNVRIKFADARVEKDSEGNLFLIQGDGKQIAFRDSQNGKVYVENKIKGADEADTAALAKKMFEAFNAGKLDMSGRVGVGYARGGMVSGYGNGDTVPAMLSPGEFVVSKKGVNPNTIGLLRRLNAGQSSQGSQIVINVSAIDEDGVSRFVKEKMAPMMREMSGRKGVVFLNQRGVSSNA